ncbi:MAG: hydrogenase maturation nickel metallochaperone HypA [Gammaproteobacteria bacterium]|nr:hydrogenase maturation nickel metallochaperone HypA [Gammaproteobacteria bacterium]
MHELSLCKNIIDIVEEQSRNRSVKKVKAIYLEIGELALIEKSALTFSFELVAKGTIAEGAILSITDVPAKGLCDYCGVFVTIKQRFDPCVHCGNFSLKVIQGDELRIKTMEVE